MRTTEIVCSGEDFQHAVQFLGGAGVGLAAEAHGGLPDGFDHGVDFLAFLVAQYVAQQAT
jgi:type 1 glutamine amidotransferase